MNIAKVLAGLERRFVAVVVRGAKGGQRGEVQKKRETKCEKTKPKLKEGTEWDLKEVVKCTGKYSSPSRIFLTSANLLTQTYSPQSEVSATGISAPISSSNFCLQNNQTQARPGVGLAAVPFLLFLPLPVDLDAGIHTSGTSERSTATGRTANTTVNELQCLSLHMGTSKTKPTPARLCINQVSSAKRG